MLNIGYNVEIIKRRIVFLYFVAQRTRRFKQTPKKTKTTMTTTHFHALLTFQPRPLEGLPFSQLWSHRQHHDVRIISGIISTRAPLQPVEARRSHIGTETKPVHHTHQDTRNPAVWLGWWGFQPKPPSSWLADLLLKLHFNWWSPPVASNEIRLSCLSFHRKNPRQSFFNIFFFSHRKMPFPWQHATANQQWTRAQRGSCTATSLPVRLWAESEEGAVKRKKLTSPRRSHLDVFDTWFRWSGYKKTKDSVVSD